MRNRRRSNYCADPGYHFESPPRPSEHGSDAIAAAVDTAPDLLISDVVMPRMAIHFRTQYPECEVLLFSGASQHRKSFGGRSYRGYDFDLQTNPVHPADLLSKVRHH